MKILLAILVPLCICICAYGIQGVLVSISDGKFDVVPLIWAIVAIVVLVLIMWYEVKGSKKKKTSKEQIPRMTKEEFEKRLNTKLKNAKGVLIAMIVCAIIFFISPILLVIGDEKLMIGFVFLYTPLLIAFMVLAGVYSVKYAPVKSDLKFLKKIGINLDSCLSGMENALVTPVNRMICTPQAMISERALLVIPYSSVAWIHRTETSVNGISMGSYWKIYTVTGQCFSLAIDNVEVQAILKFFSDKFSKDLILGYGPQQKKAYKKLKKENKNKF